MNSIRNLTRFILFSNVWVALTTSFLIKQTLILLNYQGSCTPYTVLVFCATLVLYNFERVFLSGNISAKSDSVRHQWIAKYRKGIIIIIILAGLGGIFVIPFLSFFIGYLFIPAAIISLAYFLPVTNLKSVPLLKAFIVALVWSVITAAIPSLIVEHLTHSVYKLSILFNYRHSLIFWHRFFFILPLAIAFDIRDVAIDIKMGVKSIPVIYGIRKAILVSIISLLICFLITLVQLFYGLLSLPNLIALSLSLLIAMVMLLMTNKPRHEYYYVLGIDGLMLLQPLFVLLLNRIRF